MECVKDFGNCFGIYREEVTDVLYLRNWYSDKSGLTVMLEPETGKPLTWKRYQELEIGKEKQEMNNDDRS